MPCRPGGEKHGLRSKKPGATNWTHIFVIAGLTCTNCLFRLHDGSIKKAQHVEFLKAL